MLRALTPEQSEMQQVEPSRKAWRLQVSVRAMMILVLAIGAWLGWLTLLHTGSTRCGRGDHSSLAVSYCTMGKCGTRFRADAADLSYGIGWWS